MQTLARRVQADRVMGFLADIQAEEHPKLLLIHQPFVRRVVVTGLGIDGRHPRYDETYLVVAVSLSAVPRCHQTR
ncbi:hypothetical protein [Amycolatopsis sp. NBC_01286]|uniref:hypothetical protein n=1 Tax=Amycolatopsis sp. NBC_01286 TaxID=2903560 RepID=UPI002E12B90C|nr:hypothetical protein OG570_29125 [Amycolatopsis sp. NBC_01286]